VVRNRHGRPQVYCFCVCSGSVLLGDGMDGMEDPKCTASVCVAGVYCWGMEWMAWKTPSALLLCV